MAWPASAFVAVYAECADNIIPFFAVVTMYKPSKVRRKSVAGNS